MRWRGWSGLDADPMVALERIVVASRNRGKCLEIARFLVGYEIQSLDDFNPVVFPVESVDYHENARRKALSAARPVSARAFRRNADAFVSRLSALASEFEAAAKTFRRRDIVTFHNVFDYLARDLGLTVVGEIETSPGQEPSAGEIRTLSRTIRERKVPAVFSEPQYSPKLAEALAREAGVPVRVLDPVATGSPALTTYEDAMRRNLATLKEALSAR